MKGLKGILIPLYALVLWSCEKPQTVTLPSPIQRSDMHAIIANKEWDAQFTYAALEGNGVRIVGSANGQILELFVPETEVRSFKVNSITPAKAYFTDSSSTQVKRYDSDVDEISYSGEIKVDKIDLTAAKISGSFTLVLRNTLDNRLLSIEQGAFKDIEIGKVPGTSLFYGFVKSDSLPSVGLAYRSAISGLINFRPNAVFSDALLGKMNGYYENASMRYLHIGPHPTGNRMLRYIDLKSGTNLYSESVSPASGQLLYFTFMNGKYYTAERVSSSFSMLKEYNPSNGQKGNIITEFNFVPVDITNDGSSVYFLADSLKLGRVNVANSSQEVLSLPGGVRYSKWVYGGDNYFYAIQQAQTGTQGFSLVRIAIIGSSASVNVLKAFNLPNSSLDLASMVADPVNKKVYLISPQPGNTKTTIITYNILTGGASTEEINGFFSAASLAN